MTTFDAPPRAAYDVEALREEEFPWARDTIYLNHAAVGPLPERARRELVAWTRERAAPALLTDDRLMQVLADGRAKAARLIGADPAEIAQAFSRLKAEGKVRCFGLSNFRPSLVTALQVTCPMPLVVHQVEISLVWAGYRGQRVWNLHPGGGSIGLGTSPASSFLFCRRSRPPGAATGTADSKASVYGCLGLR